MIDKVAVLYFLLLLSFVVIAIPDRFSSYSLKAYARTSNLSYTDESSPVQQGDSFAKEDIEKSDTKGIENSLIYNNIYLFNNIFESNRMFTEKFLNSKKYFQNYISSILDLFPSKEESVIVDGKRSPGPVNKKVFLYGRDDRKKILDRLEYPFFNIVRISTGCTGTLLTPSYVLTAAHCVHNGVRFRENMEMLKVEVPHRLGSRIHYITKISVPTSWLISNNKRDRHRTAFDYAVIQLNIAARGRYEFMPLHVPNSKIIYSKLYFLGFPSNSNYLWKSKCTSYSGRVLYNRNILISQCDSTVGNSGAAVYTERANNGGKIIGLLSSTGTARISNLRRIPFSFITLLTKRKIINICHVISSEGEKYGVCPPLNSIFGGSSPVSRSNRIVPFYG